MSFAKALRAAQTDSENRLWYHLRDRRFMGLKFKRQKPMGRFIADFVCLEYRLVVEADGGQHADSADAARDAWFRSQGFTVLRFWNHEVLTQTEAVLARLREVLVRLGYRDAAMQASGSCSERGRDGRDSR
jgi:very-short-patch-repair endonuclease